FEDAVKRLEEGIALRDKVGTVHDWLFLAMAHQRLGHAEEARGWLRKASQEVGESWQQRLEGQGLRREAEEIGGREGNWLLPRGREHPMLHGGLGEREIPPNPGNIARLCAATGAALHLVGRLGFRLDDRALRRAGLDYWPHVDVRRHVTFADFTTALAGARLL